MRVLIVDDNRDNTDTLAMVISLNFKYEIATAYNGLEGIKQAKEFEPDIILMDIGMPGMNGYDVARVLRKWYKGKLIAVTGWGTDSDIKEALDSGFDEHVHKPITLETLTRLLGDRK